MLKNIKHMLAKLLAPDRGLERLECSRVALVLGADQEA